jgi:N-acetyl-anhydromuramyl-L-alanine amidase AmpD
MKNNRVLAVLLTLSAPASFAGGFDAPYEVYQGDFDGNGNVDIYVRERPKIVMISLDDLLIPVPKFKVAPFVLLQQLDGSLLLRTDLTGLNLANRQASSITLTAIDVDLDGELDAVLTGIATAGAGANDQIVFADSAPGSRRAPVAIRAMDAAFKSFVKETAGWFQNSGYFPATAIQNGWYTVEYGAWGWAWWGAGYLQLWGWTYNGNKLVADTEDPYVRSPQPASCSWGVFSCRFQNGVWEMYVYAQERTIHFNYSHFNQQAIAFANQIAPAVAADDLVAGSAAAQGVDAILQAVLGKAVLRGVLNDPQSRLPYEVDYPADWLGDYRLAAIGHMLTALAQAAAQTTPPASTFKKLPGVTVEEQRIPQLETNGNLATVKGVILHRTATTDILNAAFNGAKSSGKGTHFYVDKDGKIYQAASLDKATVHVGKIKSKCIEESTTCTAVELQDAQAARAKGVLAEHNFEAKKAYPKRYPTNGDAVGIEVLATVTCNNWPLCTQSTVGEATAAQKASVKKLVEALQTEYGLTNADVYHHDKVSRKTVGEGSGLGYD